MKSSPLDQVISAISQGKSFVVACHGKPDGDTLGSALAIARALRKLGREALVLSQDGVPEVYGFLPDSDMVVHETSRRDFDTAIVCDVQFPLRADKAEEVVRSASRVVVIDHHATESREGVDVPTGTAFFCDTTAAATGEIILDVIDRLGTEIDPVMAYQLMTAVVTDTGCFRFTNVTPKTFAVASRLAGLGASAAEIARLVYESRSFVATKLLGRALASLDSDVNGRLVWAKITGEDFESLGAKDEDTEAIVNLVRSVKGADAGILFRDLGGTIRISLRSHGSFDVARVAEAFGGGGHKAAAGCSLDVDLDDAIRMVVAEAKRCMAS